MRTTEVITPVGLFIKYVPGPAPTCIPSLVFSFILQSVIVLEAKRVCLKNKPYPTRSGGRGGGQSIECGPPSSSSPVCSLSSTGGAYLYYIYNVIGILYTVQYIYVLI